TRHPGSSPQATCTVRGPLAHADSGTPQASSRNARSTRASDLVPCRPRAASAAASISSGGVMPRAAATGTASRADRARTNKARQSADIGVERVCIGPLGGWTSIPAGNPRAAGRRRVRSPSAGGPSRTRPARLKRAAQVRGAPAVIACMSQQLLDRIDQRTRLAGHNRLALLLFRLGPRQLFGVNVFKVQEVIPRPPLFTLPQLPRAFSGAADVRGRTVPVLDLARAIGQNAVRHGDDSEPGYLVVTEFNRSVQGFLVAGVDRIVNIAVEDIQPPPDMGRDGNYLTGVTRYNGELIQLIDVESVLAESAPRGSELDAIEPLQPVAGISDEVLVVDDSRVARNQIRQVLDQLGLRATLL